jgi:hypothetical protein
VVLHDHDVLERFLGCSDSRAAYTIGLPLYPRSSIAYQDLLDEVKNTPPADRQRVQRRIKEVRKQCLAVQAIIEASHAVE